jgi:endonuclease/exonuclease/phosphatase family metal-dependent hydrolase
VRAALAFLAFLAVAIPADGPVGLKVMTFNIQHGIDGSHKYNLQRAIDAIAKIQPDLVALQEVTRNHPYYDCDDQPSRIAEGLKAATGREWSVVYQQEWFTPNVECQNRGKGDGKETEGLAFLSPNPLGSSTMTKLPASRIAVTVKPPFAGGIAITATHFANGNQNGPARAGEVAALLKWTEKLGSTQLVLGDFNLKPDEAELQPIFTNFHDAWKTAADAGSAPGSGATHGTSRIDFIFHKGDGLDVTKVEAIDTATWLGTAASDHRPVVATVRLSRVLK